MEYFILSEDPTLNSKQSFDLWNQYLENKPYYSQFVQNNKLHFMEYPDFLITPFPTFSLNSYNIIKLYDSNIISTPFLIFDNTFNTQYNYWVCFKNSSSNFLINNQQLELISTPKNIMENAILFFTYNQIVCNNDIQRKINIRKTLVIIREDLLEDLMNNNFYGAIFTPISNYKIRS